MDEIDFKTIEKIIACYPDSKLAIRNILHVDFDEIVVKKPYYIVSCENQRVEETLSIIDFGKEDIYLQLKQAMNTVVKKIISEIFYENDCVVENKESLICEMALDSVKILPEAFSAYCAYLYKIDIGGKNAGSKNKLLCPLKHFLNIYFEHVSRSISLIITNFSSNKKEISDFFSINEKAKINSISLFSGDFHEVGFTVAKVGIEDQFIVFKPRASLNERVSNELLDIVFQRKRRNFFIPKSIEVDARSWHEYIEPDEISEQDDLISYYKGIGSSLAFFNSIFGSDMHHENIICKSGAPNFIDLECLFILPEKSNKLGSSILSTLIIPPLSGNPIDRFICGIGHKDNDKDFNRKLSFSVDNGNVKMNFERKGLAFNKNIPQTSPDFINPTDVIENIIEEYNNTRNLISLKIQEITSKLISRNDIYSRVIFRPSKFYHGVMIMSTHPRYMRNDLVRKIFLACAIYDKNTPLDVIKSEFEHLYNWQIPIFKESLTEEKKQVLLEKIMRQSNIHDKLFQNSLLRHSLDFHFNKKKETSYHQLEELFHIIRNRLAFFDRIREIPYSIETIGDKAKKINSMDHSIYNGFGGVMVMLIAYYIYKKRKESIKDEIYRLYNKFSLSRSGQQGFFDGDGSKLYITALMYKYFHEVRFLKEFVTILEEIDHSLSDDKDLALDISHGISGTLIICNNMYTLSKNENIKIFIEKHSSIFFEKLEGILSNQEKTKIFIKKHNSGFAHGTSGILYALGLLNVLYPAELINTLMSKILLIDKSRRCKSGWILKDEQQEDHNSWCNGAPGIFLSRNSLLNIGGFNKYVYNMIEDDIKYYELTKKERQNPEDQNLCHGFLGNNISDNNIVCNDVLCVSDINDLSLMTGLSGVVYGEVYRRCYSLNSIPNVLLLGL